MSGPPIALGNYSIVRINAQTDSDGLEYSDLSWGYDTLEDAKKDFVRVAKENNLDTENICIIKICSDK